MGWSASSIWDSDSVMERRQVAAGRILRRHVCVYVEVQLHSINMRHRSRDADLGDSGEPVYIQNEVKLCKIAGKYQQADIFTKGLPREAFQRHRRTIMGE